MWTRTPVEATGCNVRSSSRISDAQVDMQAMNEHPENQLNEGIRLYVVTTNNAMHHAYLSWVYCAVFVSQMFPNNPKKCSRTYYKG